MAAGREWKVQGEKQNSSYNPPGLAIPLKEPTHIFSLGPIWLWAPTRIVWAIHLLMAYTFPYEKKTVSPLVLFFPTLFPLSHASHERESKETIRGRRFSAFVAGKAHAFDQIILCHVAVLCLKKKIIKNGNMNRNKGKKRTAYHISFFPPPYHQSFSPLSPSCHYIFLRIEKQVYSCLSLNSFRNRLYFFLLHIIRERHRNTNIVFHQVCSWLSLALIPNLFPIFTIFYITILSLVFFSHKQFQLNSY